MTSDKAGAALLADIFVKRGFEHIIISPGSRNAPLMISFAQNPRVKAISIVDERSAAFFALGMAQQTKKTVAIACTSGGAVLNYAPAIAEAYYQKIPLLIITADRPQRLVDHGDGQTIRQKNVFANFIKASFEIPGEISDSDSLNEVANIINEAITKTNMPDFGPVHINIPFEEPIYGQAEKPNDYTLSKKIEEKLPEISADEIKSLAQIWNGSNKKLLIAGMMDPEPELKKILHNITSDPSVVILTETTSNLMNGCTCPCIDKVIHTIKDEETEHFRPDLLVTFGGNVVSKMVKAFLRKHKPQKHWHIDLANPEMDTYQCLSDPIRMDPIDFFKSLSGYIHVSDSSFSETWNSRDERSELRHKNYLKNIEYSDLKVFETLIKTIPENSNIQLGNSTAVRYAQLFKQINNQIYNSNRGTSGIDGTVSTAAGAAYVNKISTTLITGDLGFLYDSNGLMNHHLKGNLRIIIINNGGGGIFRFIPGPDETGQLEDFFEARHNWTAEFIAKNYNVPYYKAKSLFELNATLPEFYADQISGMPAILEIFTPAEKNAIILKSYFNNLKD